MARMIPPLVSGDTPRGEKQLFSKLREDPRTADWIVFHSFDIRRHIVRSEGEADMLIVVPGLGVLCIEVKGCDVARRDGLWVYSYSQPKTSPVGPFRQASDAAHSIRKYLGQKDPSLGNLMVYSAVIFTEIDFGERSLEWESWQVIGRTDFLRHPISALITKLLEHAHERCRNRVPVPYWYTDSTSRPTKKQTDSIAKLLRGDFEYVGTARNGVALAEAAICHFTEEQFDAIDHLADNRRVLFKGPAGTGKTFLALEAARRAVRERRNVALLCFNSLLSNWLKHETEALASEAKSNGLSFYVGTLSGLMINISRAQIPQPADSDFWEQTLSALTADVLLGGSQDTPSFDFLLIDEAQDLLTNPFLDVFDLLLEGGLVGGRWAMFGDFERQAIYSESMGAVGLDLLGSRVGREISTYSLRINCRNAPRIAEAVTITSGMSPGYSRVLNQVESADVEPLFYRSAAQQKEMLQATIARLLRSFAPDQIVILSNRSDALCCASTMPEGVNGVRFVPFRDASDNDRVVRYASIYSFKGMESPAVVLTDVENIDDEQSKALLYVGMSRARIQLYVVMKDRLRSAYDILLDEGLKAALGRGD